jgi:hypothetical protein
MICSGSQLADIRNTLEVMMGFRQIYRAAGLELYQDKIQLSKEITHHTNLAVD